MFPAHMKCCGNTLFPDKDPESKGVSRRRQLTGASFQTKSNPQWSLLLPVFPAAALASTGYSLSLARRLRFKADIQSSRNDTGYGLPTCSISLKVFLFHLFVTPNRGHPGRLHQRDSRMRKVSSHFVPQVAVERELQFPQTPQTVIPESTFKSWAGQQGNW